MEEIKIKKIRNFALASIIIKFIDILVTIGLIAWFIIFNKQIKNLSGYEYDLELANRVWYAFAVSIPLQWFFVSILLFVPNAIFAYRKLNSETVGVLCIIGIFAPVVGLVGAFLFYFYDKRACRNEKFETKINRQKATIWHERSSQWNRENQESNINDDDNKSEYTIDNNENYYNNVSSETKTGGNMATNQRYSKIGKIVLSILILQLICFVIDVFFRFTINPRFLNLENLRYLTAIMQVVVFGLTIAFLAKSNKVNEIKTERLLVLIFFVLQASYELVCSLPIISIKLLKKIDPTLSNRDTLEYIIDKYSYTTINSMFVIAISTFLVITYVKTNALAKSLN